MWGPKRAVAGIPLSKPGLSVHVSPSFKTVCSNICPTSFPTAAPCQATEPTTWLGHLPAPPSQPRAVWGEISLDQQRRGLGEQLVQPPYFKDKEREVQDGEGFGRLPMCLRARAGVRP